MHSNCSCCLRIIITRKIVYRWRHDTASRWKKRLLQSTAKGKLYAHFPESIWAAISTYSSYCRAIYHLGCRHSAYYSALLSCTGYIHSTGTGWPAHPPAQCSSAPAGASPQSSCPASPGRPSGISPARTATRLRKLTFVQNSDSETLHNHCKARTILVHNTTRQQCCSRESRTCQVQTVF